MFRFVKYFFAVLVAVLLACYVNLKDRENLPGSRDEPSLWTAANGSGNQESGLPPTEPDGGSRRAEGSPEDALIGQSERECSETDYEVVRVVDGDTLILEMVGEKVRVRLLGIDAPESVQRGKEPEYYGAEASAFLRSLADGRRVWLAHDGPTPRKDRYGRLLAYVYRASDGLHLNEELVRRGFARVYHGNSFRMKDYFRDLERSAQRARRGLWAGEKVEAIER